MEDLNSAKEMLKYQQEIINKKLALLAERLESVESAQTKEAWELKLCKAEVNETLNSLRYIVSDLITEHWQEGAEY